MGGQAIWDGRMGRDRVGLRVFESVAFNTPGRERQGEREREREKERKRERELHRVPEDGAGDGDALFLSAREARALDRFDWH